MAGSASYSISTFSAFDHLFSLYQTYSYNKLQAGDRHDMPPPLYAARAAHFQPIHALRLACGAQLALLPVDVGAMNIHDVRDRRRQTDVRQHHCLMFPPRGRGITLSVSICHITC